MNLINVNDYPRDKYSAYWEIMINADTLDWEARIMDRADSKVLAVQKGAGNDMTEARRASQTWVKKQMESYKK